MRRQRPYAFDSLTCSSGAGVGALAIRAEVVLVEGTTARMATEARPTDPEALADLAAVLVALLEVGRVVMDLPGEALAAAVGLAVVGIAATSSAKADLEDTTTGMQNAHDTRHAFLLGDSVR